MHNHPHFGIIKYLSVSSGAGGILWLLAIWEGHALLFSAEFGTVLASALTSAGLAVSAAMWIMNLVIDRKLSQFEKENIVTKYMSIIQATALHDQHDERYGWIKEQLGVLREGQFVTQGKIEELAQQIILPIRKRKR